MSTDPFPERVKQRKLCDRNGSINCTIPFGKLLRFSEYLHDNHGQAEVYLSFDKDETGYCFVSGTVKADVSMLCQRCLEATRVDLDSRLKVRLADTEAEAALIAESSSAVLDKLEIVLCEEGQLDLLSLVEDELIMCLPTVASHDNDQCNQVLNALQQEAVASIDHDKSNIEGLEGLEQLRQALHEKEKD